MPHDTRITIRLLPRELKALRHIVEAFALATTSLMHLPVLVPAADTDNQQPTTSNQ